MREERLSEHEPSQDVLNFLKEEILQQFSSEKDQYSHQITTLLQNGNIIMHVSSQAGKRIMSSEITRKTVDHLERIMNDPQKRKKLLLFTLKREEL